jgi:hypothetical protein
MIRPLVLRRDFRASERPAGRGWSSLFAGAGRALRPKGEGAGAG